MLVLHPSSRCDVCLDGYHWTTPDNSPHAISCGHIFCKTCLVSLDPASCPLCRKSFSPERVKRIHVDRPSQSESDASGSTGADVGGPKEEASQLLEQISFVSGESTPLSDAMLIVNGVNQWLRSQPDNPNSYRALRAAVGALERYKKLQDQHRTDKEAYKLLRAHYKQRRRAAEQDLATAQAVEANLLAKLEAQEIEFQRQMDMVNSKLAAYRRRTSSSTSLDSLGGSHPTVHKPKAITYKPTFSSSSSEDDEAAADDPAALKHRHPGRPSYKSHAKRRSRSESRAAHDNNASSWSAWSASNGSTLADSVEFASSSKGKSRESSEADGPPKPSNAVSVHAHAIAAPQPLHPLNPLPEPPEPISNALLPAFAHPLAPRPSGSGNPSPIKPAPANGTRNLAEQWYAMTGLPQPTTAMKEKAQAGPSRAPTHGVSRSVDSGLGTPPAAHFLDTLAPTNVPPPPTAPVPQGVGSLGLYSAPGSSSERRRRARAGSRSEGESHASSSSVRGRTGNAGGIVRENSAPAAPTGMGGLEIGLIGLPGSAHTPSVGEVQQSRPLGAVLGLRTTSGPATVDVPERPESASSWGTVDSPPRNPNSLSDLGLGLGSVWTPPPAGRARGGGAGVRRAQSSRLAQHVVGPAGGANGSIAEEDEAGTGLLLLTPRNRSRSDPDLHDLLVRDGENGAVSFLPHTPRVRHDRQPAHASTPPAEHGRPGMTQRAATAHVVSQEPTRPANARSVSQSVLTGTATTNAGAGNVIYPQPPRPAPAPVQAQMSAPQRPPLVSMQSQPVVPQTQPISRRAEQAAAKRAEIAARQQQQQLQQQSVVRTGYRSPVRADGAPKTSPRVSQAQAQQQRTSPLASAAQQQPHQSGRSGSGSRNHRRRNTVNTYTPTSGAVSLPSGPPVGYVVPTVQAHPQQQSVYQPRPPPNAFPVNFVPMYAGGVPPPWATPMGTMAVPAPTPYAPPAVLNQRL